MYLSGSFVWPFLPPAIYLDGRFPEGELTERVERLYEKRREIPRRHQFLFRMTKDHMLNMDTK